MPGSRIIAIVAVATFALIAFVPLGWATQNDHASPQVVIPDETTAIAISRAALIPIYGAKLVQSEEPFTAQRKGDVWLVRGTLYCGLSWWDKLWGGGCLGGTAEVKLSAKTGKILHITHYK